MRYSGGLPTRRRLSCALLLVAALVAVPAAAQSGAGVISGLVLPEDASYVGGLGGWEREGPSDDAYAVGPVLALTPIRAYGRAQKRAIRAHGSYGRYTFGRTPMGLYHLRVDARATGRGRPRSTSLPTGS